MVASTALDAPDRENRAPRTAASRWSRKHGAILSAATAFFLSDGYRSTSMEAVADRAGVSKATLYKHFGNKAALFEAIVDELCNKLFEPVRDRTAPSARPREVLLVLARQYLGLLLEPTSIGLFRALVSDEDVRRELGARSYAAGAGAAMSELSSHLKDWTREGHLAIDDCELAAEQFFGMLGGQAQVRALLGLSEQISEEQKTRMSAGAVSTFLQAFAAVPGSSEFSE